jgi:hypothetical protein
LQLNNAKRTPLHLLANAVCTDIDVLTEPFEWFIERIDRCGIYEVDQRGRLPLHYLFVKIGRYRDASRFDPIGVLLTMINAMDRNHVIDNWSDNIRFKFTDQSSG